MSLDDQFESASNPFRSGVFEKVNDPGGGGGDLIATTLPTISKTVVLIVTISTMCILLILPGVLRMFQLDFFKNLRILPF